jgi:uncharacterized protein (TIGR03437 family)
MRHFGCEIGAVVCLAGLLGAQPAAQLRQAFFGNRLVTYEIRGGYAIYQGDIILGKAADMEAGAGAPGGGIAPRSVAYTSASLWPGGVLPYTLDPALTPDQQQNVLAGIQHWNTHTPFTIRPRASESNYVEFAYDSSTEVACESWVGMQGGQQAITITPNCTAGLVIHEIGHALGLLHEQSRSDRNAWVTVLYPDIDKRYVGNFDQYLDASRDYGYFDYDSIMIYGPSDFSSNFLDTMETVPVGIPIGQRNGLSAGDIDGVSRLYGFIPSTTTITTAPAGLTVTVDGAPVQSPASYPWTPGSTHTIAVDSSIGAAGADPLYAFVRWSDGGGATHGITASSSQTVFCAQFQTQHLFTVGVDSNGGGSAAATPAFSSGYYPERQPVKVTATPAGGSQFVRWNGSTNLYASGFSASASPVTVEVASPNRQYTASFTSAPLAIFKSQPACQFITIDGTSWMLPFNQAWTVGSQHMLSVSATQYANDNTVRYQFTGWEDGSTQTTRNVTFTGGTTYTANFKTQYLLTTSYVYVGSGSVTVSPPSADGYYDAGSTVQVTATPASGWALRYWLGDSVYNGAVVMDQQRSVTAYFDLGAPLAFTPLNAASYKASPAFTSAGFTVAPGELLTVFGSGIGPASPTVGQADSQGLMPTNLGGTRIFFDGVAAPLLYVDQYQLNAVVPAGVAGKSSTLVTVQRNLAAFGSPLSMSVAGTAPAFATLDGSGTGQVAAENQDNSINSPSNPAAPGTVIQMWATGAGLLLRSIPDGQMMTDMSALTVPVAPVYVRLGKLPAQIQYAGSAPWLVNGVMQVNVWIPDELIGNPAVPVQLIIGDYSSPPGTTIAVK